MVGNVKSVMSWSVYVLLAFMIVGFICSFYQREKNKIPSPLLALGVILALATIVFPGILISTIFAVPFWNTILVPILFTISSLSVGLALIGLFALEPL